MKKKQKLLSVIIPVFNEENTIEDIISQVRNSGIKSIELIVVDDKSTDKTRKLLKKQSKNIDVLILKNKNEGKGSALREGIKKATGEILVIQDADLEYNPKEYQKLIAPIVDGKADVVYGSRFTGSEAHRVVYYWHFVANSLLTTLSNIFTNLNLTDMESCYKVFKTDIIQSIKIEENSFGIEPEITAKIAKKNLRIYEVGISYHGRTYEEGKKIGLKDAFRAVWAIFKYNLLS
ncbi:MAG: glycosyltransferase family 2 protein [Pseudomonadales bacterium]|nr:glycosyltransferase family 2 protein [Pseudomonadales bacterium]